MRTWLGGRSARARGARIYDRSREQPGDYGTSPGRHRRAASSADRKKTPGRRNFSPRSGFAWATEVLSPIRHNLIVRCKVASMRTFPCGFQPSFLVVLAALVFAGALSASAQDAQTSPPPPPAPVSFDNPFQPADLTFLNDYAGRSAKDLRKDKRFRKILEQMTPRTVFHYGRDMPLDEAIHAVLGGAPLPVDIREGRYVMVASHSGPYLNGKGFLWFDLQTGAALGGFFFHPVNGEPTPTLAIFSRQLHTKTLSMSQLPPAFAEDLSQWIAVAGMRPVFPRYFIPENGKKYVLVHDEDYCATPPTAAPLDAGACEQMNFDAADMDLSAADFMARTDNAANATAWLLNPELVAWYGVRDRSCGGLAACRIRMTRERTRVILGMPHMQVADATR